MTYLCINAKWRNISCYYRDRFSYYISDIRIRIIRSSLELGRVLRYIDFDLSKQKKQILLELDGDKLKRVPQPPCKY